MPQLKFALLVVGTIAGVISAYVALKQYSGSYEARSAAPNQTIIQSSTATSKAGPGGSATANSNSTVNNSITINQTDNRVISGSGGIVVGPGATVIVGGSKR